MTETQMLRLDTDLRRSIQITIYGPKDPNAGGAFKGMQQAPRSGGYSLWFDTWTKELVIHHTDDAKCKRRPLDQIGEISIWIDDRGPTIYWTRRGKDRSFERNSDDD